MLTGEAEGEGNSKDQTPPRSKSTSELVIDVLGEELELRKVVIGTSGNAPPAAESTRDVWANKRRVFMNEFIVG
jgi:hypothetical protein